MLVSLLLLFVCDVGGHLLLMDNISFVLDEQDLIMIDCVRTVINSHLPNRKNILFLTEDEDERNRWDKVIKSVEEPVLIMSKTMNTPDGFPTLAILLPTPTSDYISLLKNIPKNSYYIVVGSPWLKWDDVRNLFASFQQMKMNYYIFLYPSGNKINIYTSYYYGKNKCIPHGTPTLIGYFSNGKLKIRDVLFPMTSNNFNLNGCTLSILACMKPPDASLALENQKIVFERFSRNVMNILKEKFNFSPNIILPKMANSLTNMTYFYNSPVEEISESLASYGVDLAFGDFSGFSYHNNSAFSYGREVRYECYTWAVPKHAGKTRSLMWNYIKACSLEFWMLYALVFLTSLFTIEMITMVLGENKELQSPLNAFKYMYSSILNQAVHVKVKSISLHVFVKHWLVYVLVTTTAYQASLRSLMITTWEVEDLHTQDDLLDSSLSVGGAESMFGTLKMLSENNNQISMKLVNSFKIIFVKDINDIINRIWLDRNFALMGEKRHLKTYSKNLDEIYDEEKIHFLDGCLAQTLTTPVLYPKGSPFIKPFNKMIGLLNQHGFLQKFYSLPGEVKQPKSSKLKINETSNMAKLAGMFIVLFVSYIVSFFILICEIVYNFIQNKYLAPK